ncbi:MAG: methyltransferase domain-containing protein [Rubrobacteraceae bacterium]
MARINYTELDWREAILLGSALENGLVSAVVEKPCTVSEVADMLGLDRRAVYVVLSALAEIGLMEETRKGFLLVGEHRGPLLEQDHVDYVGASVVHRFGLISSWSRMPEILKSGDPVEDRTSPNFSGTPTFIGAMRSGARAGADAVAEALLPLLPEGATILDVGGGPGTNAEAFAKSGARVTVFDRPGVIELMKEPLASAGIFTETGDMNETIPDGPFEAIYFGNTSHMYGPDENRRLFGMMRDSLAPGGLLVVREFVRGMSEDAALFAVNMLVTTARGGTYSAKDYEEWLLGAGFESVEFAPVPGRGTHLILARNPG